MTAMVNGLIKINKDLSIDFSFVDKILLNMVSIQKNRLLNVLNQVQWQQGNPSTVDLRNLNAESQDEKNTPKNNTSESPVDKVGSTLKIGSKPITAPGSETRPKITISMGR